MLFEKVELFFCSMKNILTPLIALLLAFNAHAKIHNYKFVDAQGKEPEEQNYDQDCQLVDADTGISVPNNTVILEVDDELVIDCPVEHRYFFYEYEYSLNKDAKFASESLNVSLNALKFNNFYLAGWMMDDTVAAYPGYFNFDAARTGNDSLDIYFVDLMKHNDQCYYRTVGHHLGHIEVIVNDASDNDAS